MRVSEFNRGRSGSRGRRDAQAVAAGRSVGCAFLAGRATGLARTQEFSVIRWCGVSVQTSRTYKMQSCTGAEKGVKRSERREL
jgi:hypothetical protein